MALDCRAIEDMDEACAVAAGLEKYGDTVGRSARGGAAEADIVGGGGRAGADDRE